MAETLTIQITAADGATRVFKAVEGSATSMGKAVESAGKTGTSGMRALADEVQRLESELDSVGKAAVGVGAAITGALAVPLAKGTKAAWDQVSAVEQATFALGAYGDTTEDVNAALQDLTRYAQDASRSGGIFWSQDLFGAAQTLRTLGAELDNVSEYVQIMSRSVGIGAGSWDRLLEVIGRVGSTGRITALDLDELAKMGFQLDRSIAGMAVTWDELFAILDRGIPAEALLGQADTIQGALLYLEGAFVKLGQAFLGVDENFQFIAGGLGDQLVQGLRSVTESVNDLAPAAAAFGQGVGTVVEGVFRLVDAFNALPEPVQTFIAGATGMVGATTLAAGSLMLMVGPLTRVTAAMKALAGTRAGVAVLSRAFGPLGLAITGVSVAAFGISQILDNIEESASGVAEGIGILTEEVERLKLAAEEGLADQVQGIVDALDEQVRALEGSDWGEIAERLGFDESIRWEDVMDPGGLNDQLAIAGSQVDEFSDHIVATLNDIPTRAGQEAYLAWITDLLSTIEHTVEGTNLDEIIEEILITPASEVPGVMEGVTDSIGKLTASVSELAEELDYLDIRGQFDIAEDVERLGNLQVALSSLNAEAELSEGQLKAYGEAWDAIGAAIRSGDYDADAMLDTLARLQLQLATDQITAEQYAREVIALSLGLHNFEIAADEAAKGGERLATALADASAEMLGLLQSVDRTSVNMDVFTRKSGEAAEAQRATIEAATLLNEAYEERQQLIADNMQALLEVAGFGDPLSQWNLSGAATDASLLASALGEAATSLDTVFRVVVGNTDAIASQVQGVEDWALELINVRGEYGLIDDLIAAGRINQEQYNAAQEAQETISAANLAIQEDVLTIQAMQAPLIAEHTAALEAQMGVISNMSAEQQLVTLGWMDSATAAKAMEFQMLGAAAAAGELGQNGEQFFANIVAGQAIADPALKAVLLDMGMISEGADGSITVHIPEQTMSEMDRLTTAIVALADLMDDGELNGSINMDVLGIEEVEQAQRDIEAIPARKDVEVGLTVPDGLLSNFVDNVIGGDVGIDLPVRPQLPDNASELLQASLGGQAVEIEVAPVIKTGMDWLSGGIGALLGGDSGPQDVTVTIDAIDNATPVISDVTAQLTALGAWNPIVEIGADARGAAMALNTYSGYDGQTIADAIVAIGGDGRGAASAISTYSGYDGVTIANATVAIGADARGAASAINTYSAYDGVVLATSYIDIVTRTSTVSNNRHGGIPGYAHGGVIAELAEAGPEVLHVASGGTATVFDRGIYSVPPGTYVSPNNTYSHSYGGVTNTGDTYHLHVHGNVYGIDDLVDSFASAIDQRRAGFGGVS